MPSWRVEESASSATRHRLVIFADSTQKDTFPQDYSSAHANGGAGIRFHRGQSMEAQDTFQSLSQVRHLPSSIVTVLSTDYKTRQAHSASSPTATPFGGKNAPVLESYLPHAPYASGSSASAQRQANLHMQALEARFERTVAGGTVRTLRAGTSVHITQSPLPDLRDAQGHTQSHPGFNVIRVTHLGLNNLPKPAVASLAELFGDVPELLGSVLQGLQAQADSPGSDSQAKSASSPGGTCANSSQNHSNSNSSRTTGLGDSAMRLNPASLITQAQALGYANQCELLRADVVWRPMIRNEAGTPLLPRASAPGAQTALVVGPNGSPTDTSAGDLYTDRLGRVRICFAWQGGLSGAGSDADGATSGRASTWVRVAQRSAGGGMGMQFLPRVGQEVLVQFLGGDIDRPIITGALYNGQGVGGVAPTPGGLDKAGQDAKATKAQQTQALNNPFANALDHSPSAQGNLIAGSMSGASGNSPAWFGSAHGRHGESEESAAQGGHANAAAQWGIRTQEWGGQGAGGGGGAGYNQLVFDDTDHQSRIQLKTTQYSTELNMGHLIHTADNHRGSLRGQGFELRTDAYGAVRAGAGLMFTTYGLNHNAASRDPAGDNSGALALLKQATLLSRTFSEAAATHQTVTLASHTGSLKSGASAIDDKAAPIAALYKSSATQVSQQSLEGAQSDAAQKSTAPSTTKLPHSADPILSLAGQGGIAVVAGQSLQWANAETTSLMSGQDSQGVTGGQLRMHAGQAIGILGGAIGPGEGNKGLTLIAAQDPVRYEAQSSTIALQAKDLINIQSANSHIDWAAAKTISLSTAGGANITITGGNITVQCPGNLTVHASSKNFEGPARMGYGLPALPKVPFEAKPIKLNLQLQDAPGSDGAPLSFADWEIVLMRSGDHLERVLHSGQSDAQGRMTLSAAQQKELEEIYATRPNDVWISTHGELRPLNIGFEQPDWTNERKSLQAMASLDYSDLPHFGLEAGNPELEAKIIKTDHGRSAQAMWNEIKKA